MMDPTDKAYLLLGLAAIALLIFILIAAWLLIRSLEIDIQYQLTLEDDNGLV